MTFVLTFLVVLLVAYFDAKFDIINRLIDPRKYRHVNITETDLERVAFLKQRYIPELEAYKRLGMITEEEYEEEMKILYGFAERLERKTK